MWVRGQPPKWQRKGGKWKFENGKWRVREWAQNGNLNMEVVVEFMSLARERYCR
jgi:hypothetical protein